MSYKDLVVATGSATLANGTFTYLNSAITPSSVVLTNVSALGAVGTGLHLAAVSTAGQVIFTSIDGAGAIEANDVYSFTFAVLQNNFTLPLCG